MNILDALRNVIVSHETPTYGDELAYTDHMSDAVEHARAALAAHDPLTHALAYCETRDGEFWRRLAGSIRKAMTMEGET